ncbi:ABC transporter permease [Georgenia subflava]|uniref:ABC transporter permease n=1 Tax=Georgenia subflava TaxID=1622177 RepID=A0A6N7EGP1_9MICO|nr:ABC transporter permease [Georgenia subflava]MPV36561.1 ABC transporter permease [Georgenia subflava]
MSSLSTVWLVARREVKTRMMTKANIISLAVMLVLIVAGSIVGNYFLNRDAAPEVMTVAVAESVSELTPQLEAAAQGQDVTLELPRMTADEAEEALRGPDGEDPTADAFLDGDPASPELIFAEGQDAEIVGLVASAVQAYVVDAQISELGGDPAEFGQALAAAAPQVRTLETAEDDEFDGAAFGVAMVMISVLLFALIGSGSLIAMGVVEEKTSRVVEILLATIKPTQLLAGKILGIGIYGLFQVVVLGGALAAAVWALGLTDGISVDIGAALVWLIVWFLLGYALYALLFGGFAALVSRQEDIGSVTTPLMFLLFIPFYATMFLVPNDPDGTLATVLSQVPFFAPFMMPVRDAFGVLAPWEMPLAIAIAVVVIPLLVWVAARVYRRGVLHTGGRMKLTDALKG